MTGAPPARPAGVARHAGRLLAFAVGYLGRFLRASLLVTREIVTPGRQIAPAVLSIPLRCRTDVEVASYISLLGLTPGTFVIGTEDGRPEGADMTIAVHAMHAADPARTRSELRDLEDRMLAAWRNEPRPTSPRREDT